MPFPIIFVCGCAFIALLGISLGVERVIAYARQRRAAVHRLQWDLDLTLAQLRKAGRL